MPAISRTNCERGWLVRLSDPNLLDPAEIAVGGLDDEAVRLAEPRVCLGNRSHSRAGRFRLLPVTSYAGARPWRRAVADDASDRLYEGGRSATGLNWRRV